MAKGLNKHTPDSDELLKRLNSNDSSGLDDFEKEALEGFDSLEDVERAKELTNSLNKRLDEVYFKEEKTGGNKKGFMYLSLAAGLVLVIGLSIYFTNIMGDKKEMAMENAAAPEKIANEVSAPTDLAPAPEAEPKKDEGQIEAGKNAEVTTADESKPGNNFVSAGAGGKNMPAEQRAGSQPDKDDGLKSRMVVKESKTTNKTSDTESGDDLKKQETDKLAQQGPPSGYVSSPAVAMDSKAKESEESKSDANEKTVTTKGSAAPTTPSSSNSLAAKEPAKKSEAKDKRKDQANGESLGREDDNYVSTTTTADTQKNVGGVVSENSRDESGYKHNVEYSNNSYSKPQDYIKTEISKSEMLKTNVKAFKAELTIDENGKVKDVKFLTAIAPSCKACEKELRKILINMPGWKASPSKKAVKETVSYIDN